MEHMEAKMQDRYDALDKEMQAALAADGENLSAMTGEDHGTWEKITEGIKGIMSMTYEDYVLSIDGAADHGPWAVITDESPCPRCNETGLWRESADVGVGIIYGPYGCPSCGWSENEEYDLQKGGGVQPDGSYIDPYGGLLPAGNPIAKMLARGARGDAQ